MGFGGVSSVWEEEKRGVKEDVCGVLNSTEVVSDDCERS
jgi:hypothetical protein